MNKINELIKVIEPNNLVYKKLYEVTYWDKKFNNTTKKMQPLTMKFKHVSSKKLKEIESNEGNIKLLSTGKYSGYTNMYLAENYVNEGEVITIPTGGSANIKYFDGLFVDSGNLLAVSADSEKFNLKYIYYWLLNNNALIESYFRGAGVKHPNMFEILKLNIPFPSIEVQNKIVHILDKFVELKNELEEELTARKKQYNFYRDIIMENTKSKKYKLSKIGKISMCKRVLKKETTFNGDVPFYKIGTFGGIPNSYISTKLFEEYKSKYPYPKKGEILISASGTIGKTVIFDGKDSYFQDSNIIWISNDESIILNKYLFYFYQIVKWPINDGGIIKRLYNNELGKLEIHIPSISDQNKIVSILDKFHILINDISNGIPAEIEMRKKQYEYYRDKLLNFKEVTHE